MPAIGVLLKRCHVEVADCLGQHAYISQAYGTRVAILNASVIMATGLLLWYGDISKDNLDEVLSSALALGVTSCGNFPYHE